MCFYLVLFLPCTFVCDHNSRHITGGFSQGLLQKISKLSSWTSKFPADISSGSVVSSRVRDSQQWISGALYLSGLFTHTWGDYSGSWMLLENSSASWGVEKRWILSTCSTLSLQGLWWNPQKAFMSTNGLVGFKAPTDLNSFRRGILSKCVPGPIVGDLPSLWFPVDEPFLLKLE